ncbi:unnamed protein product [Linum trigynum]|uniref:Uncharacterized protein n=1 Tax=Linum trigynum TaxID=586398 RepID=A0AAV2CM11_9ROSI
MGGTRVLHREWSRLSLMRTIVMRISRSLHLRVDMDECRLVRQHHVLLCIGTELGDSYHLLVRRQRARGLDGVGEDVRVVLHRGSLLVSVLVDLRILASLGAFVATLPIALDGGWRSRGHQLLQPYIGGCLFE